MQEQDRDDVYRYLDELRDSGETNMFGAAPYLQETFGFERSVARQWLLEWMRTFTDRHAKEAPDA